MTWSTTQPGRDDDRIIPGVNQSIDAASPRPFHANCGRTAKSGEDQIGLLQDTGQVRDKRPKTPASLKAFNRQRTTQRAEPSPPPHPTAPPNPSRWPARGRPQPWVIRELPGKASCAAPSCDAGCGGGQPAPDHQRRKSVSWWPPKYLSQPEGRETIHDVGVRTVVEQYQATAASFGTVAASGPSYEVGRGRDLGDREACRACPGAAAPMGGATPLQATEQG